MKIAVLEILLCLNVISHVVFGLDDSLVPCSGGSSLLGLDKWNSTDLRCCDPSGVCHGYDIQSVAIKVTHSLQNMLNATLPIPRSTQYKGPPKEESRIGARHEAVHVHSSEADEEVDSPVTPCCWSKLSVFYPITGISATSRKRVAVVQIEPFKQPVVYERCHERKCRILRGNCVQVYAPQPLYILQAGEGGELAVKLDFILVEAGCQCQTRPVGDGAPLSGSMGVDASVAEALRIITGSDFDADYFTMLASIDAASAIAGPNQATIRPAVSVATTTSAANTEAPIIDPHELGNPTTVIASPTASTPLASSRQTEMITSSSSPESSHDLSSGNEITSPSPFEWTTTTTVLPLPVLPDHGQPILILPGQFNPLLQFLKNFQNNQF
ncbi:uncharacterized protein LOC124342743 isoform X2 [Daphnia pulicaria]|uniref:uncharacterized protein LOC124342743 isoform X2 n=1 Tax=Daphnia pulicaria TaxID=35523 RepID=UPI001EEA0763|nr:uncharacterized protein LOC124342743 isoform X2 [Daphnia pulicaria]